MKSKMILMALALAAFSFFPGCEKKGPAEKAGEQIDEGIENIQDKADEAGEEIEDAAEDVKESVDE